MSDTSEVGADLKKPVKEIVVVQDEGFFKHETGDTYDGFFEAKKKDRCLKMNGPGVYTTAEGDVYRGIWEADRLRSDEVNISYTDGSKYDGQLKEWCYNGRGTYTYPDGTVVTSDFVDNAPSRDMVLTDPNGHVWLGHAGIGYGWLQPWNHFYQELERPESAQTKQSQHAG